MRTNGEAIYGTKASPWDALAWGRCTKKPLPGGNTRLYFHVFNWPVGDYFLELPIAARPLAAKVLGSGEKINVTGVNPQSKQHMAYMS